ncbi:uncharacterized protein J7T54_005595 [Emericellopsis cladophorae]|uniref:Uncharacterized protein n=1 Tax=Emericellopsis cladophorae TaxID=2686198 RepID=A0A9P9Y4Y4_9HYPO|nr:uncharacterized protein J7T54_005595 [Emericellopsis cladophorae]KAI6783566.1 hypothetical protein J7T54_005595 [Emericellopsis cladophorae]
MECQASSQPAARRPQLLPLPLSVSPPSPSHSPSPSQPATNLRVRRKLQKTPKQLCIKASARNRSHSTATPTSTSTPTTATSASPSGISPRSLPPLECSVAETSQTRERPTMPMPTDLSDSKWLEYIERSGLMSSADLPYGLGTSPSNSILSDLSNLTFSRSSPRPSLDSVACSPPPPRSSSSASVMHKPRKSLSKRSLIAPAFKLASFDGLSPKKSVKEIRVVKRKASVELIAEQYQAFLESRDAEEEEEEAAASEEGERLEALKNTLDSPMPTPPQEAPLLLEPVRFDPSTHATPVQPQQSPKASPVRDTSSDRQRETIVEAARPEATTLSPGSDGTLVAFEEDAIYFKPVSFSCDSSPPASQRQSLDKPLPRTPQPETTPLSTSISMLSKELTAGMPSDALQIGVMIEAYERLRDQTDTKDMGEDERRNMRSMFDSWLAALHTMQRGLRGSQSSPRSDE